MTLANRLKLVAGLTPTIDNYDLMNSDLRFELGQLWQQILRSDPKAIFGYQYSRLQRRHWGDEIPQPGFVGGAYQPGGLVFVSMNPGGGEDIGADDRRQFEVLLRLRDAKAQDRTAIFEQLTEVLATIMPRWIIYRNFVAPILRACANRRVAYVSRSSKKTVESL